MRIWFDLSNSPHVNMFFNLIRELENDGNEIIITSRPLANTISLLEQKGMNHTVIGKHYGKSLIKKMLGYPVRVFQLIRYLRKQNPDIAVSQSSFHSPLVAWFLNIPSIYTNDNEHALGNYLCFYCATKILIPESMQKAKLLKSGISAKKLIQYPGVKEGIYLWSKCTEIHNTRRVKASSNQVRIYIRPEPQMAQYYNGRKNFLDELITAVQDRYSITVLTRDIDQAQHYRQDKFYLVNVPASPLSFDFVACDCSLFIGAGGSMTRELALLGIPVISVYQDKLLGVDKLLVDYGLIHHEALLTVSGLEAYISNLKSKNVVPELVSKGEEAYNIFKSEILKFKK